MFARKKTVEESKQLISNIDLAQIREEIREFRLKEKQRVVELQRQKEHLERLKVCQKLDDLIKLDHAQYDFD